MAADAGVVYDHVQIAEPSHGRGDGFLPVRLAGDVQSDEHRVASALLDVRDDLTSLIFQQIADRDPSAFGREQAGMSLSEASGSPADERRFARHSHGQFLRSQKPSETRRQCSTAI